MITGLVGTLTHKRVKGLSNSRFRVFSKTSSTIQRLVNALAHDPNTTVRESAFLRTDRSRCSSLFSPLEAARCVIGEALSSLQAASADHGPARALCSIVGDSSAWIASENGYFLRRGGQDKEWEVRLQLQLLTAAPQVKPSCGRRCLTMWI